MAPNVKETPNVIDALALLDVYNNKNNPSTPAFLPLTHPLSSQQLSRLDGDEEAKEECEAQAAAAAVAATATRTAAAEECNYWDWPCSAPEDKEEEEEEVVVDDEKLRKEEMIKQILQEEEIREMLSVSHIEANLIKDAARRCQEEEEKEQLFVVAKRDDSSEEEEYEGYWDMTPPEHDLSNRDLDKNDGIVVAQHVKDATHPFHTYWDNWDTSPRSERARKEELIRQLLRDERARRIVSLDALEERLVEDAEKKSPFSTADGASRGSNSNDYSDLYWTWNTSATTSTCSPAPPANDKYWDWPTLSPAEVKQQIIDGIVREEEIRQLLSIQHVEETESKKNRLSNGTHDDSSKLTTSSAMILMVTGDANDSYWDW